MPRVRIRAAAYGGWMLSLVGWIRDAASGIIRSASSDTTTDGVTPPTRSARPSTVSVSDALSVGRVYRAVQIHAIAAKQLSIETTRYGVRIEDHPLTRRPDPSGRRSSWVEQAVVSLATTGNGYMEIIRDTFGQVVALPILNPLDVRIRTDREGRITGYGYHGRELRPENVQHITLLRVPGTAYGLGPIQAAQRELYGAISTRDYAAAWMDDSGVPTGILKSDANLTKEQADLAKERFNDNVGHRGGVAVLGNGLDYRPILLRPKDVQFIESQQFSALEIAMMFGVPPTLMLIAPEGGSQTYQNVEQEWLAYSRFTLMGYLVEIEDALSDLLPGAQRARFNIEALLRADTSTRYRSYLDAIAAGFMTVNEVRAIEGWDALPDTAQNDERAFDIGMLRQLHPAKEITE